MSRVLFLRHGESAHNAHTGSEALSEEQGDQLTERGVEQARAAAVGLRNTGVTRLLCSPMRRARETVTTLEAELGLEAEQLDYVGEWQPGEEFGALLGRARRLRTELEVIASETDEQGEGNNEALPLLVGHGILFRVFLLDVVLGEELADALDERLSGQAMERIWQMGSHNCGLSLFARGESRYPGGLPIPGWTCLTWMARP
jgi:hypothetical protein